METALGSPCYLKAIIVWSLIKKHTHWLHKEFWTSLLLQFFACCRKKKIKQQLYFRYSDPLYWVEAPLAAAASSFWVWFNDVTSVEHPNLGIFFQSFFFLLSSDCLDVDTQQTVFLEVFYWSSDWTTPTNSQLSQNHGSYRCCALWFIVRKWIFSPDWGPSLKITLYCIMNHSAFPKLQPVPMMEL